MVVAEGYLVDFYITRLQKFQLMQLHYRYWWLTAIFITGCYVSHSVL